MLDVLFSLLGGVALVLLPVFFIDYAAREERKNYLTVVAVAAVFAFLASAYLALSFWLFGFLPIFIFSTAITFYLVKKREQSPDFVVEGNLLDDALSDDLASRLEKELEE